MLKRVQHDKKKYVIPNQVLNLALKQVQGLSNSIYRFRNLEFANDDELIAIVLEQTHSLKCHFLFFFFDSFHNRSISARSE